jgi:hypothetical protein
MKSVQLEHVLPCWEIGIAPASENALSYFGKGFWVSGSIVWTALNEIFRVLGNPGMIVGYVVRDKIENQAEITLG